MKHAWLCVVVAACGSDPNHPVDASIDTMVDAKIPVCGDGFVDVNEQCDDHNQLPNDGCTQCQLDPTQLTASWTIRTTGGVTQPCPATFNTAAVYSQMVNAQGVAVGSPVIDLFDCATGTGTTAPLAAGPYVVHIEITTANNSAQYASSVAAPVDLTHDAIYNTNILTDGGYFQFAWNLTKSSNGAPLTCADVVGIDGVESVTTDVSNATNSATDIYSCADGTGITGSFLAGTYTVSIDAINAANQAIGTAAPQTNKVIQAPNKVTNLGTVTIPIDSL